jgi:hypothetical protein
MHGVVGEVLGDAIGVARVERLVVGADVVEVADGARLTAEVTGRAAPPMRTSLDG